ncbi:MAG TPA: hypothetical protein GXX69_00935 [Firmicutes bacterium]|nr:hypothetical protein [Syntrophomonadaceae bacterium]HHV06766.1 hypothetical protein [Bacillota bacterium]
MEYIPMGLIIIALTIFNTNINILQSNQERIESKLNRIIEHLGLSDLSGEHISDELKDDLVRLVEENQKVKAIKKLREATGMRLKEAKDYVDSL